MIVEELITEYARKIMTDLNLKASNYGGLVSGIVENHLRRFYSNILTELEIHSSGADDPEPRKKEGGEWV